MQPCDFCKTLYPSYADPEVTLPTPTCEDCKEWWLERPNLGDLATSLGLEIVPIIHVGPLHEGIDIVQRGLQSTCGESFGAPTQEAFLAEGLVGKPSIELTDRKGSRIMVKIKHRDFGKK